MRRVYADYAEILRLKAVQAAEGAAVEGAPPGSSSAPERET